MTKDNNKLILNLAINYGSRSEIINAIKIISREVSVIVDREALTDILGPIKIDYSEKNLVEQGFVFEQLINGHQCGCGESFTPVKDLEQN